MLEELISVFIAIKQVAYYAILLSFKTGQLIVHGIKTALELMSSISSMLWSGLVVIGEDFGTFALDFAVSLRTIVSAFMNGVDNTANKILELIYFIQGGISSTTNIIVTIYNGIIHVIMCFVIFVGNLLNNLKYFFILFGQGVWFAVTIIPLSFAYICISSTYLIGRLIEESSILFQLICTNFIEVLKNFYQFVVDVPVESFVGLMIAVCIFYVLIKCHIIVFKFIQNLLHNFVSKCQTKFTFTFRRETENVTKNGTCVICFERSKCLLTMPCRHLCMCLECWEQLQHYQFNESRSCPVCRKPVQYTIHVY